MTTEVEEMQDYGDERQGNQVEISLEKHVGIDVVQRGKRQ